MPSDRAKLRVPPRQPIPASLDLCGTAHAPDHRAADEVVLGQHGVARHAAKLVEMPRSDHRIALLEQLLVANRLSLHELDVGGAALSGIAIEQAVVGLAAPHLGKLRREVEGAVQGTVETEGA